MNRLPPLNALKAFEAASRRLSFTHAAAELHVTHGAVSRQIAALEEHLGTALFVRGSRGLQLTAGGQQLALSTTAAFEMLRSAAGRVAASGASPTLLLSAPPTLAMRWLIPRLTALHHAHPTLRLDISTSTEPVDFASGQYDAAIRRIEGDRKGIIATPFLDGRWAAVCSPRYKKQHKLNVPADLRQATLVVTRSEPDAWEGWLHTHNIKRGKSAPALTFDQLYFALQAALDSLGVALIPLPLVTEDIKRGRLCQLAAPFGPTSRMYALLSPSISPKREAINTLGAWLRQA